MDRNPVTGFIFDATKRFQLPEERFLQLPGIAADHTVPGTNTYASAGMQTALNVNPNFMISGTNATSALCTRDTTGGITLTTAGASGDQMLLGSHTATGLTAWNSTSWNSSNGAAFEATIKTGASIASLILFCGLKLTNTPVLATDANSAYFTYQDINNSGAWQCNTSIAGATQIQNTTLGAAVSSTTRLLVYLDANRYVYFAVNDVVVSTLQLQMTANISFLPFLGIQATTAAAKAFTVKQLRISRQ